MAEPKQKEWAKPPVDWRDEWYGRVREKNPKAYNLWSAEEDEELNHEAEQQIPIKELMAKHGRTRGAMRSRLVKLGLMDRFPIFKTKRGKTKAVF